MSSLLSITGFILKVGANVGSGLANFHFWLHLCHCGVMIEYLSGEVVSSTDVVVIILDGVSFLHM